MNNMIYSAFLGSPSLGQLCFVIFDYYETWLTLYRLNIMAFPVMEFQDQGYKIRKVFA